MIDDDNFFFSPSHLCFPALLDESHCESQGIEAGTKEEWRNSLSDASHERCYPIEADGKGELQKFTWTDAQLIMIEPPSGSSRVLRLSHSLLLGHRRLHGNCIVVLTTRGLLFSQLHLQSVWRPHRVLWRLQGWDMRRRLHGKHDKSKLAISSIWAFFSVGCKRFTRAQWCEKARVRDCDNGSGSAARLQLF